jgi:alkanesulfonate monooxygenase SsuD/methylene tetrahydromethanopterin reductase-like flavin-dependent oxidoreductase (luciferase family)
MATTLGIVFRPQSPPEELRRTVEQADHGGVDELWLWEDCFLEGGLTSAAAALSWSERLHVGVGLLPVPLRNPALAAMEIATLARLWPGRFTVALGHGVQEWMGQVGARAESPMTLLREQVSAVGALLDGETVTVDGRYVHLDNVALDWPPARRPTLLIGARGPKTIELAGELADGVLLDSVTDVSVVQRARDLLDDARSRSGRPGRGRVYVYTELETGKQTAALAGQISTWTAELSTAGADTVILQAPHDQPDPSALVEALGLTGLGTPEPPR